MDELGLNKQIQKNNDNGQGYKINVNYNTKLNKQ